MNRVFDADGVVCLRGAMVHWVERLRSGVETNLASPGPHATDYGTVESGDGLFFDDYCNWQRIEQFAAAVHESPMAGLAEELMGTDGARFFHDHVLVKEPGASRTTPWHADSPYYLTDPERSVSFWIPLDPVDEATLRLVAGSHRWERPPTPTRWLDGSPFYPDEAGPGTAGDDAVPDPDTDPSLTIREWALNPGDVVAFHFRTVHGARANSGTRRRRAVSFRFVEPDARYVDRGARTSPPFPGHGMSDGDPLRDDWFPLLRSS